MWRKNKELGALRVETHISCDLIEDGGRDLEGGGAEAREHMGRRAQRRVPVDQAVATAVVVGAPCQHIVGWPPGREQGFHNGHRQWSPPQGGGGEGSKWRPE